MSLVWIAEDDQQMRSLVAQYLEDAGFDVRTFEDGAELIERCLALQEGEPRPALVVTDHHMPSRHGLEAVAVLRRIDRSIPVIVITGFGDLDVHERAQALGVTKVLDKPFDLEDLVGIVNEHV